MSTTTLTVSSGSFTAVSVMLIALARMDTGAPVPFSPPAFTSLGGGSWSYPFTDVATPVPLYAFTYTILYANGQSVTRTKLSSSVLQVDVRFVGGSTATPSSASLISETVTLTNESVTLTPG